MDPEQILERVRQFAAESHGEQKRKYSSEPYIVHPVRVMKLCAEHTADTAILAAALLHDVLEDTMVTEQRMSRFLETVMPRETASRTMELVTDMTDVFVKSAYPHLNRRERKNRELARMAGTHPDAHTIKYADIIDNSLEIVSHDRSFAGVYLHECRKMLQVIPGGHPELYRRAKELVTRSLGLLGS